MSGGSGSDANAHRVTRLLSRLRAGELDVADELARLVYDDLCEVAERRFQAHGHRAVTLEPAALVNECWLRLVQQRCDFANRSHFLAVASRLMLRVLLDHERRGAAIRRGGDRQRVTLSFELPAVPKDVGVEAGFLHEALERLEHVAARKADVARLHGLAGLSLEETSAQVGASTATVERDWAFARAWLSREVERLRTQDAGGPPPTSPPRNEARPRET